MPRSGRLPRLAVVGLLLTVFTASSVEAQYFGRNKVQYRELQLRGAQDPALRYPFLCRGARGGGRPRPDGGALVCAPVRRPRSTTCRRDSRSCSTPRARDFQQTNVVSGEIGEGTGGVTEGFKRRIVLPLAATLAETDHVLGHELVHAFQYDIAKTDPESIDRPGDRAAAAVVHRRDGGVPVDRSRRSPHGDVDPRRGAG